MSAVIYGMAEIWRDVWGKEMKYVLRPDDVSPSKRTVRIVVSGISG